MARLTLGREYNVTETLRQYGTRIEYLERRVVLLEGRLQQVGGFALPGGYDTGWVDRSSDLNAGFSAGGALESRRIGFVVYWRGRIDIDTDWGTAFSAHTVISDMGAEWTPGFPDAEVNASGAATSDTYFRVLANSTGVLQVRCSTASHTGSVYMTHHYLSGLAG